MTNRRQPLRQALQQTGERKEVLLGWCMDGHHRNCRAEVQSNGAVLVCRCPHHRR